MKLLLKSAVLFLSFGLAACQPTPAEKTPSPLAAAETDLMDRHEKAMQQTGRLYELRDKIGPATPTTAPYLHGLLAADNAMMAWMHHYQPDTAAAEAQRLAYFRQQQNQLAAVEKQLNTTIDSATLFVKHHPSK